MLAENYLINYIQFLTTTATGCQPNCSLKIYLNLTLLELNNIYQENKCFYC